jgi:hypothetical protein
MLDLNSVMLIRSKHAIFLIFRNDLNGIWDFYHGTNRGTGSPKSFQLQLVVPESRASSGSGFWAD